MLMPELLGSVFFFYAFKLRIISLPHPTKDVAVLREIRFAALDKAQNTNKNSRVKARKYCKVS